MADKKKVQKKKNQQNAAQASTSVSGKITQEAIVVKNSEAEDALNKVVQVLSSHRNENATLEEGLKPEIDLIRSEIIRSKIRVDLLISNKSKCSEMEVNNNNLKLEQQKLIVSINNYKQSVNNQVKLLQFADKKAIESQSKIAELQSKIAELQSKIGELQGENDTLRDELKMLGEKYRELIATGESLTAQMELL